MRQLSQNGPEFRYVLSYTPDRADGESTEVTITDSSIGEYEVDNTPTYAAYRIWVKALNKMGEAIVPPLEITGYSGEDSKYRTNHGSLPKATPTHPHKKRIFVYHDYMIMFIPYIFCEVRYKDILFDIDLTSLHLSHTHWWQKIFQEVFECFCSCLV